MNNEQRTNNKGAGQGRGGVGRTGRNGSERAGPDQGRTWPDQGGTRAGPGPVQGRARAGPGPDQGRTIMVDFRAQINRRLQRESNRGRSCANGK